jgi:hypothetical protein
MDAFGSQEPRILHVPPYYDTSGQEAIELAQYAGLELDPWQQLVLREGLGEKESGLWSAFEVSTVVSRQNGKGAIIEARELAGLFLFGEKLIIHTAHEFKTSAEAFSRVRMWIDNCDDLRRKVKKIITGKGSEAIELLSGQRLRFLSRTQGSGRGFSCDCLIMDESMILGSSAMAALLPTLSARENPQVWYFGSAGMGEVSTQLALLRQRALTGGDDSLAYFEWSVDVHNEHCLPSCTDHYSVDNQEGWLAANPGVGYRITMEYISRERRALGPAMFARERLGVGDYPDAEVGDSPITVDEWVNLTNRDSEAGPDVVFAVDIPPDRSSATIASFSVTEQGWGHVELIDRRFGTEWVPERLAELKRAWNPVAIAMDAKGPSASLLMALEAQEIVPPENPEFPVRGDLFLLSVQDMMAACGQLVDAVRQETFRHLGDEVLTAAVTGACTRPVGDAWVWTRRKSTQDVSPLVAATVARYAYMKWWELVVNYDVLSSAW